MFSFLYGLLGFLVMGYMTLQKPPQSFIITNKVFRLNNQIYFKGFLSFGMLFNYTTFRHMSIINLGENSVSSVKTKYGNLVAVDDVDFEIYKGEIFPWNRFRKINNRFDDCRYICFDNRSITFKGNMILLSIFRSRNLGISMLSQILLTSSNRKYKIKIFSGKN